MLPNNKLFIVWVLDGLGLCKDVIRWEVVEWLVDWEKLLIKKFGVDWRNDFGKCFDWCCSNGYLEIAKWLWEVSSKKEMNEGKIDIHANNGHVFRESSRHGHSDVVRWLWKINNGKFNMNFRNERALPRYYWRIEMCSLNDNTYRLTTRNGGHIDIPKQLRKVSDQ